MRGRAAARLGWSTVAASVLLSGGGILLLARSGPPTGTLAPTTVGTQIAIGLGFLVFPLVGALIVSRRPEHPIGWLFCLAGVALALANFTESYAYHALDSNPGSLPGGAAVAVLGDALWVPDLALTSVFLFLLFPGGRLSSRWERITARVAILAVAVAFVGGLTETTLYASPAIRNPLPIATSEWVTGLLESIGFFTLVLCVISSAVMLVRRFRRSRGEQREQMKWFVFSATLVFLFFVPSNVLFPPPLLLQLAAGVSIVFLPVSVGIAILRYRLYDIDVVISKTVVYGSLAAFITTVYVAVVVGVGNLIGSTGKPSVGLSILATAIVAVAVQPIRRSMQRVANRLVYGERATPYEVLTQMSRRAGGTYATEDVVPRTARVIAEGVGAAQVDVWLRVGDELQPAASWPGRDGRALVARAIDGGGLPAFEGVDRVLGVTDREELLGAITVTKPAGEPVTTAEDRLLADVASQAGLVLRNVALTTELQARLGELSEQAAELRASRQRIVAAQDAERKRLERNIHDGAQQHLVALAVKLRLAKTLARTEPAKARRILEELQRETSEAVETLRDLARGIYPPVLEEHGIAGALSAQVYRSTTPVRIETSGVGRHAIETEAAIYFCCLEALQNAAKYANASEIVLTISEGGGELAFSVEDDGRGFDPSSTSAGSGLQNMADRIEALGGRVDVISSPGRGTRVSGRIPITEPELAR
jgi:signal transduction histidine kinase